jgi:PST family polysaccharide transporter
MTGVMWTYAATAGRLLLQIGLTAVLARVLGPTPFGIVGMGIALVGLAGFVVDQGLTAALIQRPTLTDEHVRTAFTRLLVASVVVAGLGVLASGWIAAFFREPALRVPMMVLSLMLIPNALSSVSVALLRRQFRIRAVQLVSLASYATGYGLIALPLALAGAGVWSLVAASMLHFSMAAVLYYALTRHPVRLRGGGTGGLSRFGTRAATAGLLSWFVESFPGMMVGRAFGAATAGTFNAAMNLARTPATALSTGGLEMLFTSSARAEQSLVFRQRAFKVSTGLIAVVALPAFGTIALIPETLVIVLYGPKWTSAMPLLPPLALAMPALMFSGVSGALLASMGRPGRDLLVQATTAALLVAGVLVALDRSSVAVTWVILGAMIFRALLSWRITLALTELRWRDLLSALRTGAILALAIPPLVNAVDDALAMLHVHRAFVLAFDLLAGGILLAAGIVLFRRSLDPETRWAIAEALRRIPFGIMARFAPVFDGVPAEREA